MIRALIETHFGLAGAQLHLVFLGLMATGASTALLAALGVTLRRRPGGPIVRLLSMLSALASSTGLLLAFDTLPAQANLAPVALYATALFLMAVVWLVAATAGAGRSAVLMTSILGMVSLGTIIQLVLVTSTRSADPLFQMTRYYDFLVLAACGFAVLLGVGYVSSKRQGAVTNALYLVVSALGLIAIMQTLRVHPKTGASLWILGGVPLVGMLAWLTWLRRKHQVINTPLFGDGIRSLRRAMVRATDNKAVLALIIGAPILAALLGIALGASGGSARDASRVTILGTGLTPGLIVPFLFAPALGVILGRKPSRWNAPMALGLTLLLAALMIAQKEVGNTGVIMATAAVVFLVMRGTVTHLAVGAAMAVAAVAVAYTLAPVVDAIPYTLYERVQLWLGRPDLMRNGGSLVAAGHITYDVGGFWGVGIHETSGLNLHALIGAIDTDFPLTVLGHAGGMILLSTYVVFFVAMSLMLVHTVWCLDWATDRRRARWQAPTLAGLLAVPVVSTAINLSGAIAQVSPFTGIPVVFVSYSATFLVGSFLLVAFFLVVGNRSTLRSAIKRRAEREALNARPISARVDEVTPAEALDPVDDPYEGLVPLGAGAAGGALPMAAMNVHEEEAETASTTARREALVRQKVDMPSVPLHERLRARALLWRMRARRGLRQLRFRTVDGGIYLLVVGILAFGALLGNTLFDRYTDPALHYGHPRLTHELRIETVEDGTGPLRWRIAEAPDNVARGILEDGDEFRVDSLLLRYGSGRLNLIGQCFTDAEFEQGVRIGFAGLLDAPRLPLFDAEFRGLVERVADLPNRNDIVLPEGDIAMEHVVVRGVGYDRYAIESASEVGHFEVVDPDGNLRTDDVTRIRLGSGFRIGVKMPRTFMIERPEGSDDVCLMSADRPIEQYALSTVGPTVLSGKPAQHRQQNRRTVDFEYAERIKLAAEAGILTYDPRHERLEVIDYDKQSRAGWSDDIRRRFNDVFDIVRIEQPDGTEIERLAWTRPFYADGGRAFDPRRELELFSFDGDRVMGLTDSHRFSRPLPTGRPLIDPERQGLLFDRHGKALVDLDLEHNKMTSNFPGGASLVGYAFEDRATRDGLLRVFGHLLRGVGTAPDPKRELQDMLDGKRGGPWGNDVHTTLDPQVQQIAFDVVQQHIKKLDEREPSVVHHGSAVVLGPRNEILAAVQMPDAGEIRSLEQAAALKHRQLESPLDAPALDAYHRVTTLGSTVKLLTTIAAFQHKEDTMVQDKKGEYWIKNSKNGGYFADRGSLTAWRGIPIVPIKNYGGAGYGRAISVREMLVRSVNTAASYLGLNVGKENFLAFTDSLGLNEGLDLVPVELSRQGQFGHLLERFRFDPVTMSPAQIAKIPDNERWTLSYTARLALSGMSDYSVMHVAAAVSVIARGGMYYPPRIVTGMRSKKDGREHALTQAPPRRIIEEVDAETIQSYMQETVARGTAARMRSILPEEVWKDVGAKTGTGETVTPVNLNAVYSRLNKPATRDNKILVAIWPLSSPDPYVVCVVYEEISHLDKRVAVESAAQIIKGLAERDGVIAPEGEDPDTEVSDVRVLEFEPSHAEGHVRAGAGRGGEMTLW